MKPGGSLEWSWRIANGDYDGEERSSLSQFSDYA